MAASAPIQFTVDQEQLKVVDTNVARTGGQAKKRMAAAGYSSPTMSAVPRPMYVQKPGPMSPEAPPTPIATPPVNEEDKKFSPPSKKESKVLPQPTFKADIDEGESPKTLATEPKGLPREEALPEPALKKESDEEDGKESKAREGDIYAEKVLACSIENPESCVMCSG